MSEYTLQIGAEENNDQILVQIIRLKVGIACNILANPSRF